jgi:TFIIF-interacting CTD phosphatase-like protein
LLCVNYFILIIYRKDLSKLGRDLKHTIIVDNIAANFKLHYENGIEVRSWTGDPNDTILNKLKQILIDVARDH